MKKIIFLFLFLSACGGATGDVVQEGTFLEDQVAKLEATLADKDVLVAQKDALVTDAKALVASLEAELAAKQTLFDQQRTILRDMDNERQEAVNEADGCDERIEELETNNDKLQQMLDICQGDLG